MPETYRKLDFDSNETSELAVKIMKEKKCLNDIYKETYRLMMNLRKKYLVDSGKVLEIGSGGGFIKDIFSEVITSDIKPINNVDMVINAEKLPFEDDSLDAIFAVHVIHHIPDIDKFLNEAKRVLKPGGGIVCVEPYWSPLAYVMFRYFHPEPYDMRAENWSFDGSGPMTSSNQALSYLILKRDKKKFQKKFPFFKKVYQKRFGFLRYILTGGIWLPPKLPNFMFGFLKHLEILLAPIMPLVAIHHVFVLKKEG